MYAQTATKIPANSAILSDVTLLAKEIVALLNESNNVDTNKVELDGKDG